MKPGIYFLYFYGVVYGEHTQQRCHIKKLSHIADDSLQRCPRFINTV